MRSISSIGIEIISSLASFSTTSLCRQVTITPYSLLEPTIRPFSDTFHCLIFVFFVYLALILGRGEVSVQMQTFGLIPPPCFIFESFCFADGILYLLVRGFRRQNSKI